MLKGPLAGPMVDETAPFIYFQRQVSKPGLAADYPHWWGLRYKPRGISALNMPCAGPWTSGLWQCNSGNACCEATPCLEGSLAAWQALAALLCGTSCAAPEMLHCAKARPLPWGSQLHRQHGSSQEQWHRGKQGAVTHSAAHCTALSAD